MELDHFLEELHKIRQLLTTCDGMTQTTHILRGRTKITQHVPTLSHKRHDLRENVTQHKMYVLIPSTSFV
jgi:hypothetical protein